METDKKPQACVAVMIWKDKKILLGKRCGKHAPGEYSMPGGRMEYTESFKNAIKRETEEEAGVKIKNIKFQCLANIYRYSYRQDVLAGFIADWEEGVARTDKEERIGEWDWYSLDNLPSPLFHPTQLLIDSYNSGKNFYDKE